MNKNKRFAILAIALILLVGGSVVVRKLDLGIIEPVSDFVDIEHLAGGSFPIAGRQLAASQTVTTVETIAGTILPVLDYDTMVVYVEYVKGDETDTSVTTNWLFSNASDATEFNDQSWGSSAGVKTIQTADSYKMTATGDHYITYDVSGIAFAKVYVQASGTLTTAGSITLTVGFSSNY